MNLPKAIICDIDGVIANHDHRINFFNPSKKTNYEFFYDEMGKDTVNEWCINILSCFTADILLVTERPEKYRKITLEWLRINFINYQKIFMRSEFLDNCMFASNPPQLIPDDRASYIVKKEIYELEIRDKYNVLFVLEDSLSCANMYRNLGLIVLLCK